MGDENKRKKLFTILGALIVEPPPASGRRIRNDCYLEMMITHLAGKCKDPDKEAREVLKSPQLLEWIEAAVTKWESQESASAEPPIMAFAIRLVALAVENEWQFSVIKEKRILDRIQDVLRSLPPEKQTPSVQLANVVLLNAVAQHTMGLCWIKQQEIWRTIVEYCEKNQTVYVVREALNFLYKIIRKFSVTIGDQQFVEEVLRVICRPIVVGNPFEDKRVNGKKRVMDDEVEGEEEVEMSEEEKTHVVLVDDQEQLDRITPSLNIVCHILEQIVTTNECHEVARFLIGPMHLQHLLWGLAQMAQDRTFIGRIMHSHVLVNFAQSMLRRNDPNHDEADFNTFGVDFFNYMSFCIGRRLALNIITMAEQYHTLWSRIKPPPPEAVVIEGERIRFEDQVLVLQLLPILYVIKSTVCRESRAECIDGYIIKLFNISCGRTIRLVYAVRDLLRKLDPDFVAHLATKSIQAVLALKDTMHRARAIMVLQALIYTLKGLEMPGSGWNGKEVQEQQRKLEEEERAHRVEALLRSEQLLAAILTGMYTLIKSYRVTWKECIESTVLVSFMLELLSHPNLSTRHAVQALQLIQLSIEHFLAPNLALLVDTLQGSGMEQLTPVIYKKLHDTAWEIRDSTLELLTSMIQLSKMKFPPFQKYILESGICPIVFSLAQHDSESYVRASALKCLTEMVHLPVFWDECLVHLDLVTHLLDEVLCTESEGVVRREGVVLLTTLYEKKRLLPKDSCLDSVFSTMAFCAVNDLYWEVKTNALRFWMVVMCLQFQHQGVIDNTFPAVTFSKEHKKIVHLTQKEILRRLTEVLNELSVRGCLGIFLHCLEDSADLEVVKVTTSIVQRLQGFLDRYRYMDEVVHKREGGEMGQMSQSAVMDTNYQRDHSNLLTQPPRVERRERNRADVGRDSTIRVGQKCVKEKEKMEEGTSVAVTAPTTVTTPNLDVDGVIDAIVEAQDVNLLAHAYENQLQVNAAREAVKAGVRENGDEDDEMEREELTSSCRVPADYYKEFATVTPCEFLRKVYEMDLGKWAEERSTWIAQIENFDSLLDDILLGFTECGVENDADCY